MRERSLRDEGSFLGRGWRFPPAFSQGGAEVEMVSAAEDVHQSLQILLATRPGERVMHEGFGCDLQHVLFDEIDQGMINTLNRLISDAILYHEPRITLDRLDISESAQEPGLLLIQLEYTIRSTNSRYNMVYPFYVNEATVPT
jgi:phage baseplate assembly protein W